jgi:uncharacterized protein YjbJ (UPF0337 family)
LRTESRSAFNYPECIPLAPAGGLFTKEDSDMNDDQIKGKAKDIGGKVQEEAGKVVGSSEQQAKGLSKQVEGKVQEKAGDLRDAIDKGNR